MMRRVLAAACAVAALHWGALAPVRADEPRGFVDAAAPQAQAGQADDWGLYFDHAERRAELALSPDVVEGRVVEPRPALQPSLPFSSGGSRAIRVPAPVVPRAAAARALHRRGAGGGAAARSLTLRVAGAAGAGLVVVLLAARRSPRRRPEASPRAPETPPEPMPAPRVAMIRPTARPLPQPADSGPVESMDYLDPPSQDEFKRDNWFAPRQRWWAITAAEQEVIDRWDRSVEKEYGMLALVPWLEAHAKDLKGVDVMRLKAKIWRLT